MRISNELEGRAGLRLITGDYDEQYLIGQGVYHFMPEWSGTFTIARLLDASEFQIQLGARYNF